MNRPIIKITDFIYVTEDCYDCNVVYTSSFVNKLITYCDYLEQVLKLYERMTCIISETLVEQSKWHITDKKAIENIREYLVERDFAEGKLERKYEDE